MNSDADLMDRASRRDIVIRPGAAEYTETDHAPSDSPGHTPSALSEQTPSPSVHARRAERHPYSCLPRKHADDMATRRALSTCGGACPAADSRCSTQSEYLAADRPNEDPDGCRLLGRADVYADDFAYRTLRKDLEPTPAGGVPIRGYSGELRHFGHAPEATSSRNVHHIVRAFEAGDADVGIRHSGKLSLLGKSTPNLNTARGTLFTSLSIL